jgi:hypothetical protein
MRQRMHQPIPEQGQWAVAGHQGLLRLSRVPTNVAALRAVHHHVTFLWLRTRNDAARKIGRPGTDYEAGRRLSPAAANSSSVAKYALCRQAPEVGAACGNPARGYVGRAAGNRRPYRAADARPVCSAAGLGQWLPQGAPSTAKLSTVAAKTAKSMTSKIVLSITSRF